MWTKDLNTQFSKEGIHMAHKHIKRLSILIIIREMQIKITMRYHLIPIGMATIKKTEIKSVHEDAEIFKPLHTVCENIA